MLMENGGSARGGTSAKPMAQQAVPTIVFHGDQDQTVHPRNGEQVISGAVSGGTAATNSRTVEYGVAPHGRHYTRSVYTNACGTPLAEHWVVHGAGHAWSGGQPDGSYTDPTGPDATREMLRFFFSQPHRQTH